MGSRCQRLSCRLRGAQLSQQGTSSRVIAEVGLALAALAHDTPAMHSVAQDALLPLCRRMEVRSPPRSELGGTEEA